MAGEVYLFTGPEAGEKNDALENIKQAARKAKGEIEEHKYYAGDIRTADLVAELQGQSLFSPSLFVTVRNAEQIKLKGDVDLLLSWIKVADASQNTLVLLSDENSIDRKIESAVASDHKKIFWEMFENQKPQWVEKFFRKNGFSVSRDAVTEILEMVENDTETLKNECSRFFYCFDRSHLISAEDVDKILSHNREENAFTLFDAMADSAKSPVERFENALEIFQKIRATKDSGTTTLIAGLTYCFRQLNVYHSLFAGGKIPAELQLKSNGFAGKKVREKYDRARRIWTPGTVSSILALLSATDMAIRETGTALEETYATEMIYSIVIKNGIFCADYFSNGV